MNRKYRPTGKPRKPKNSGQIEMKMTERLSVEQLTLNMLGKALDVVLVKETTISKVVDYRKVDGWSEATEGLASVASFLKLKQYKHIDV